MLRNKTLSNTKQLIETLLDRVIIYDDYIQVKLTFAKTKDYSPNSPTKEELAENGQKNNLDVTSITPRRGGEGEIKLNTLLKTFQYLNDCMPFPLSFSQFSQSHSTL